MIIPLGSGTCLVFKNTFQIRWLLKAWVVEISFGLRNYKNFIQFHLAWKKNYVCIGKDIKDLCKNDLKIHKISIEYLPTTSGISWYLLSSKRHHSAWKTEFACSKIECLGENGEHFPLWVTFCIFNASALLHEAFKFHLASSWIPHQQSKM